MTPPESVDDPLTRPVFAAGSARPFGELTVADVEARAAELSQALGLGHRSRVGAVASAWRGLAELMRERSASTVAELDREEIAARAERLWVVPPGGSLLP